MKNSAVAAVVVAAVPDRTEVQAGAGVMVAAATVTVDVVVVAETASKVVAAVGQQVLLRAALPAPLRTTNQRPAGHVRCPSRFSPGRFLAPSWRHG